MPITKDQVNQKLNEYLTLAEQEQAKIDPKLQAKIENITEQIIKAGDAGRIRRLAQTKYLFIQLLQLFPEAYKRHLHAKNFMEVFNDNVVVREES